MAEGRKEERRVWGACHLCLGVYLGRDMKNASNGPRGTSPFKSTAILLPTCHHFSDQKLPARVTFPYAVYQHTNTHHHHYQHRRPTRSTPSVQEKPLPTSRLTKHAKLYYTPAHPQLMYLPDATLGTYLHGRETFSVRRAVTPTDVTWITFAVLTEYPCRSPKIDKFCHK